MKEFLRSKKLTAAMLGFTGLLLIVSLVLCALFYFEPFHEMELGLLVEGEYAIDGGDMKPLSGNPDMEQSFTILIAKGKLHENCYIDDTITISSRNVWYIITDKDGGYISGYLPPDDDKGAVSQYADGEQPGFAERLSISATLLSASTMPVERSTINRITSAISMASCACSRICDRMTSLESGSMPPVSIRVKSLSSQLQSA